MTKNEIVQKAEEFVNSFNATNPTETYCTERELNRDVINDFLSYLGIDKQINKSIKG